MSDEPDYKKAYYELKRRYLDILNDVYDLNHSAITSCLTNKCKCGGSACIDTSDMFSPVTTNIYCMSCGVKTGKMELPEDEVVLIWNLEYGGSARYYADE